MILQLLVVLVILYGLVLRWQARHRIAFSKHFKNDIKTVPILGHAYLFVKCHNDRDRWNLIEMFGKEALKQGGALCTWNAHMLYFLVADPVIAECVMKSCLEKDDAMKLTMALIGNGSAVADVPIWRPRRKVLVPTFSQKYLMQFEKVFSKQSMSLVKHLQKVAGERSVSMGKYITRYTMDSVCETTLGINSHAQENHDQKVLRAFMAICRLISDRIIKPWLHFLPLYRLTTHYTEFMECVHTINIYIQEVITNKREERAQMVANKLDNKDDEDRMKCFLELMIESSDYSDQTLKEEAIVLFTAGTDTSSVAISFTSVLLARHPDVQAKVYKELNDVFGDSDRPVQFEDLHHLKYLEAVIKESLRLYPPAPLLLRKVENDVEMPSGLILPKDTGVVINVFATHRNTKYWGDDAEEFRPERFLEGPLTHPAAFLSFSNGPRNCIGYRYAIMSMKTVLSTMLRKYRIRPHVKDDMGKPIDVKFDIMLRATDGFQVILQPRT